MRVCDINNFSPGYILKVNQKELGGVQACSKTQTHIEKRPAGRTGHLLGGIRWPSETNQTPVGWVLLPCVCLTENVWWCLNSKSSVQCCTHVENCTGHLHNFSRSDWKWKMQKYAFSVFRFNCWRMCLYIIMHLHAQPHYRHSVMTLRLNRCNLALY